MLQRFLPFCVLVALVLSLPGLASAAPIPFGENDSLEEIRAKIETNGYDFTVGPTEVYMLPRDVKERMFKRRMPAEPDAAFDSLQVKDIEIPESLPEAYDSRNVNGRSYIGPVRDQGNCGCCYAFSAAAAAEGSYNMAMGLYNENAIDFSESFIAWCLGKYGPYVDHFGGCDGADYDYYELLALTREGIILEEDFPYTGDDPGSCTHWEDSPRIVFNEWSRTNCSHIEAIKAAIMKYGVVDAAVYLTAPFYAYTGGIYEDSLNGCPTQGGAPCYYTPTNHAISLVGWDDNDGDGYWILRNSWGDSWGEGGYMRIKYDSARVSCSPAYITYQAPPGTPAGNTVHYAIFFCLLLATGGLVLCARR